MGLLKSRPYSQAWKYKDDIKKMKKLHAEYMFLADNNIHTPEDLSNTLISIEDNKKSIEREQKKLYRERLRYRDLWELLDKLEELSPAETAYAEGDSYFKDEHDRYIDLQNRISDAGFTVLELDRLRSYYDSKLKALREEHAGAAGMLKMAKAIDRDILKERDREENNKEKTIDKTAR